uniref:Alternative protein RAD54L n=1 Tax=Homo sapiens TaxID=9606 RepID=L8E913_HUMAN|nr:alternative protein RAD54L [Homo sapiens]
MKLASVTHMTGCTADVVSTAVRSGHPLMVLTALQTWQGGTTALISGGSGMRYSRLPGMLPPLPSPSSSTSVLMRSSGASADNQLVWV